jgi:hypothetical protein
LKEQTNIALANDNRTKQAETNAGKNTELTNHLGRLAKVTTSSKLLAHGNNYIFASVIKTKLKKY